MLFLLVFVQGVAVGSFCSYIAGQKARDRFTWFLLGFLFSLLALVAIASIPALVKSKPRSNVSIHAARKCPFCAEAVQREAVVCRFCQRDLPRLDSASLNIESRKRGLTEDEHQIMYELGIKSSRHGFEFKGTRYSSLEEAVASTKLPVK